MNATSQTSILFFGVEVVPAYYVEKCKEAGIETNAILKTGSGVSALFKILGVLKRVNPKIIYVHSNAAVLPARLHKFMTGSKLVLVEHHNNQLKTQKDLKRSLTAQKYFDRIVFLTEAHQKETAALLKAQFRPEKSVVIRTGIPESFFSAKKKWHHAERFQIGMQSRLVPIKDHGTLIAACALVFHKFPSAELRIAGDGSERKKLENLVEQLHLKSHVIFEGMLGKSDLSEWLEKLDIYVHATLGETSSISLMEALAKGLPVIASDVSGVNNFLDTETAILVPPKNVELLADALMNLIADSQRQKELSANAYIFARANCSLQTMAEMYQKQEDLILRNT